MAKSFRGGVHPDDRKRYTAAKPIEAAPLPPKVIIPTRQHIGAPCTPVVKVGDAVKKGQVIAEAQAFVSSPIHASISGKVTEIAEYPHPVFGTCPAVVIESDGLDEWADGLPTSRDWRGMAADGLKDIIRRAGIVGMGGAAFPTHVKLAPPPEKKIDTFILNGAECEPFLTADHRVMLEAADRVAAGMQIAMKALAVDKGFVGIEENKPDAIAALQKAVAGPHDAHEHRLLAVDDGRLHLLQRCFDLDVLHWHVAHDLVGHQHADLAQQRAEGGAAGLLVAHQRQLVLHERMIDGSAYLRQLALFLVEFRMAADAIKRSADDPSRTG